MTISLPLMKNVLIPLAKNVLLPFGLSAAILATDANIKKKKKKNHESCRPSDLALRTAVLIISNEEMEDIMKIVKSPEESGLLIQEISETMKNETKKEKDGFLSMLFRTLAASILGNALAG